MKLMSDDGKFKGDEILKKINGLKTPLLKEEGLRVYELCKNVEGSGCDAGFQMVYCILKNSEKAREIIKQLTSFM